MDTPSLVCRSRWHRRRETRIHFPPAALTSQKDTMRHAAYIAQQIWHLFSRKSLKALLITEFVNFGAGIGHPDVRQVNQ